MISRWTLSVCSFARIGAAVAAALFAGACIAAQPVRETPEAKEWLDRAVQAAGGPSVVYGCRTLIVKSESKRAAPNGRIDVATTTYLSFPLSVRQEVVVGGQRIAMASTPEEAFLVTDQGPVPLGEVARRSIELPAMRNPISLLKARGSLYFRAELRGTGKVGDRDVQFVEIRMAELVTTIAIDAETGRIVQETYEGFGGGDNRTGKTVVSFDDFRTLPSGLVYPHRSRAEFEGVLEFESVASDVHVNEAIDPALFVSGLTRPAATWGPSSGSQLQ